MAKTNSIVTKDYELIIAKNHLGLLVLFPCFPCDAENTKAEFNIVDIALKNGISLLLMNFNQHFYTLDSENNELADILSKAIVDNKLGRDNIYIGGFSSGGNVALLLSNYLIKTNNDIKPAGVFIVDSPIDLLGLYEYAKKILERNTLKNIIEEGTWVMSLLKPIFGNPDEFYKNYEKYSPYSSKTNSFHNLTELRNIKVRLYTEPDNAWWTETSKTDYEDTNAYFIKKFSDGLQKSGGGKVEYITTKNRGYRANGERHPHSWSIVDEKQLIDWILEK